jgi:hypothetical protein
MPDVRSPGTNHSSNPWPLVLCLIGVDYFSTLAYLPSIAVDAAGPWAPVAAGGVVLATFFLALPVYWYVVARSPDGRGAAGLLENLIPGWRGKAAVLTLLGFAAADFVITRSLSVADAAVHLIHNPHGQRLLKQLPRGLRIDDHVLWPPLEHLLRVLVEPQVAITLGLSIVSFAAWQILKRGVTRRILQFTAVVVVCYLALLTVVIGSALWHVARHPEIFQAWLDVVFATNKQVGDATSLAGRAWPWTWLSIALWSFPQMALGLSGFEMILAVVPQVSGGHGHDAHTTAARVRNTRKLMVVAAAIMGVYLLSAVLVTTLFVPRTELGSVGAAEHRALAYVAHGAPLVDGLPGVAINPIFGHLFGDLFDVLTALILCLAGASVTLSLQNMLPHYLNRLGMEVSWAGKLGVILVVLNVIVLLVTVVFQASPSSQQWAYATSVLALLAGAALAAAKDLGNRGPKRVLRMIPYAIAGGFFVVMTGLTVLINHSGLTIAMAFVVAILVTSIISRWIRSTELRFEGFDFADDSVRLTWDELCRSGPKVLAPHRPGLVSLAQKSRKLQHDYRLDPQTPVIFIEAFLGDPSNFYQKPYMKIEREEGLDVIRVWRCVSISHVLAAICVELCRDGGEPPEIIFGWSNESPLAANLNFLMLGEGNIPWMVKELIRKAMPATVRRPRILIG